MASIVEDFEPSPDVISRLITELNTSTGRDRSDIEKELFSSVIRNKDIQMSVASNVFKKIQNSERACTGATVKIRQELSNADQSALQHAYRMFKLDFSQANDTSAHGYARASRVLEEKYIMRLLGITANSKPINGYDCALKDVGGNPITHLNNCHRYIHTCAPILGPADNFRKLNCLHRYRIHKLEGASKTERTVYMNHTTGDRKTVCWKPSQHCDVTAQNIMFLHSIYDIDNGTLATIMARAHALVAVGCFIFVPEIFITDKGYISRLDCYYKKFNRNGKPHIRFWFANDTQTAYEHDYNTYLSIFKNRITSVVFKGEKKYYQIQTIDYKNCVMFFQVCECIAGSVPRGFSTTVYTCETLSENLVLYYYRWDTLRVGFNNKSDHLVPIRVIVPKAIFDGLYSYALSIAEGKFTVKNLLVAAMTFNTREITNGMSVTNFRRMEPVDVQYLVHAVFLLVYISQYEASQTTSFLMHQENVIRTESKSPFVLRYLRNRKRAFLKIFSNSVDHEYIDQIVSKQVKDQECSVTGELKKRIHAWLDALKCGANPVRDYETFMSDYLCKFITIEEEIELITSQRKKVDRGVYTQNLSDFINVEMVKRAMFEELPEEESPLYGPESFEVYECESHHLIAKENSSKGDCIYESLRDHGVTGDSCDEIRKRLLSSVYMNSIASNDSLRENLRCKSGPGMFGDDKNFMLIALEYQITVCVHTSSICRKFGNGPIHHFSIKNVHCVALLPDYRLEAIVEDTLPWRKMYDRDDYPTESEVRVYEGFIDDISAMYKLEESFSSSLTQHKEKLRIGHKTVDPLSILGAGGYSHRDALKMRELFVRCPELEEGAGESVYVRTDGAILDWLVEKIPGRKHVSSTDVKAPIVDRSSVHFVSNELAWGDELNPESIIKIREAIYGKNHGPVALFISNERVSSYIPSNIDVEMNDTLLLSNVILASSVLAVGGDAVFLTNFIPSQQMFATFSLLCRMFEEVKILGLHTISVHSFEKIVLCKKRRVPMDFDTHIWKMTLREFRNNKALEIPKEFSRELDCIFEKYIDEYKQRTKAVCKHIHRAKTVHESQEVLHPFVIRSYEELLKRGVVDDNSMKAGAMFEAIRDTFQSFVGIGRKEPVSELGKGPFCESESDNESEYSYETAVDMVLDSISVAEVIQYPVLPSAPPAVVVGESPDPDVDEALRRSLDTEVTPSPKLKKNRVKGFVMKMKSSMKKGKKKNKGTVNNDKPDFCGDWDDYDTGIRFVDYSRVLPQDSKLVPRVKTDSEKPETSIDTVDLKEEATTKKSVVGAMEEYMGYLSAIIQASESNFRLFSERIIGKQDQISEAIIKHEGGWGCLGLDGKFVVEPEDFSEGEVYNKYYNAKGELKPIGELPNEKEYNYYHGVAVVYVNEYTKLAFEREELQNLRGLYDVGYSLPVDTSIVQAGPGTGKTTYIVRNHTVFEGSNDPSTVLLATREGCSDFRHRVKKLYPDISDSILKKYYRTLSSYLLNPKKNSKTKTLYIDEALMSHPGALFFAIKMSCAERVRLLGDVLQIPFVNRVPDFRCNNLRLVDFLGISEVLEVSYRCPLDVAYRLHPKYLEKNREYGNEKGLKSANHKIDTCRYVKISSVNDIPKHRGKNYKYLTYTHSDKDALKSIGLEASTVHEYQGKECENVVVVRLNQYPQTEIFLNENYALVALTRHRNTCVYYTKVVNDALCKLIKVNGVTVTEVAPRSEIMKVASYVSGAIELFPIEVVRPNTSYATFEMRSGSLSRSSLNEVHFVPKVGLYRFNPPYLNRTCDGVSVYTYRDKLICTIESSEDPTKKPSIACLTAAIRKGGHILPKTFGITSDIFDYIDASLASKVFYKHVRSRVIVCDTKYVEEIEPAVFSLMNVNATNEIPNSYIEGVATYSFPELEHCEFPTRPFDLALAQNLIDDVFYESAYIDQTHDAWMVHTSDLCLFSGGYTYSSIKGLYTHPYFDSMSPVLKTPMYQMRGVTSREVRLALEKRNLAVPKMMGTIDYAEVSSEMLDSMIEHCFCSKKLSIYNREKMNWSANDVHDWLAGQESYVKNQIVPDFCVHKRAVDRYNYSIKRSPKPNLTIDAVKTYAALQTIVYHEKDINAIFCVFFRKLKQRMTKCLRENVLMFCDMSPHEFESELTRRIDDTLAVFSGDDSYIFDGSNSLEIDISKYDKSQGLLALEYDCKVLEYFGAPGYIVELWRNAHFLTKVYDRATSLKCLIPYQRKSGDASTFILNTAFLMGVISHEIPISQLSTIDIRDHCDATVYALLFNLEVKFFSFRFPYFCSKFLLKVNDRWVFCPDPLKLLVKLGRSDLVNDKHVEFYRVSFEDNVSCYRDFSVCLAVSQALCERYNINRDYTSLLQSLPKLAERGVFNEMFFVKPGAKIDTSKYVFSDRD